MTPVSHSYDCVAVPRAASLTPMHLEHSWGAMWTRRLGVVTSTTLCGVLPSYRGPSLVQSQGGWSWSSGRREACFGTRHCPFALRAGVRSPCSTTGSRLNHCPDLPHLCHASLTAQPLEKRPREQWDQLLWADCRGCQPAEKHCAPHDPVCRAISSDSLGTTVLIACFLSVCVQIRSKLCCHYWCDGDRQAHARMAR